MKVKCDHRSKFAHYSHRYLRPPGRRFGIMSAVNLAIEEQVSQAVKSRNDSSSKTKLLFWTHSSFAKLRGVSVLEIRTAF